MKNQLISSLLLIAAASATNAAPLTGSLDGSVCIISAGDHADSALSFTMADLTQTHGSISPGDTITHSVTFQADYGVTDPACADATVAVSLGSFSPPATDSLSYDSLTISGAGTTRSPILNNTDPVTVMLTMTAQQSSGSIASTQTYSVPFTLSADVQKN